MPCSSLLINGMSLFVNHLLRGEGGRFEVDCSASFDRHLPCKQRSCIHTFCIMHTCLNIGIECKRDSQTEKDRDQETDRKTEREALNRDRKGQRDTVRDREKERESERDRQRQTLTISDFLNIGRPPV